MNPDVVNSSDGTPPPRAAKRVTKAVIPAAGLGTRFLPATKAQPKEMLPVVDRPAIQYVVEEAVAAGIDDILIITGRNKRSLEDHFDRNFELEYLLESKGKMEELSEVVELADLADIHFVRQGEPLGLGHAVSVARKHIGDNPFVVMLGDDIMTHRPPLISEMMDLHGRTGGSVIALKEVPHEEISLYGCAEPGDRGLRRRRLGRRPAHRGLRPPGPRGPGDRDGDVVEFRGVVEKPAPEDAPSNLAVVGRYLFTPRIFEFLEDAQPGVGGEIQLTDAMDKLLAVEPMHGLIFESGRYDIGQKIDFLRATVEMTLERDDLGPEFASFLARLVAERGLT